MSKPADTEHVVYVAVDRELLPHLRELSGPVRLRVTEEVGNVVSLEIQTV